MQTYHVVTGATGHLGSALVRLLLEAGHPVRALVLPGDPAEQWLPQGVEKVYGNLLDAASLTPLLENGVRPPPVVYHCAGMISTSGKPNPLLREVNVTGTGNMLAICKRFGVSRFIHVSSVHALPELPKGVVVRETSALNPDAVVEPYAKSKAEATLLVLQAAAAGLPASVVFPTGLCGPGDHAMGHTTRLLLAYAAQRIPMGVRGGFDFVDARDVARGLMLCASRGNPGEAYLLGNRFIPISELFSLFSRYLGGRPVRVMAPMWLARMGLPLFSLLERHDRGAPLFTPYALYTLSGEIRYSHEKAETMLGYATRPFAETIADTVAWLRHTGHLARAGNATSAP
jgi:dihydroflavonol-4-reductase